MRACTSRPTEGSPRRRGPSTGSSLVSKQSTLAIPSGESSTEGSVGCGCGYIRTCIRTLRPLPRGIAIRWRPSYGRNPPPRQHGLQHSSTGSRDSTILLSRSSRPPERSFPDAASSSITQSACPRTRSSGWTTFLAHRSSEPSSTYVGPSGGDRVRSLWITPSTSEWRHWAPTTSVCF